MFMLAMVSPVRGAGYGLFDLFRGTKKQPHDNLIFFDNHLTHRVRRKIAGVHSIFLVILLFCHLPHSLMSTQKRGPESQALAFHLFLTTILPDHSSDLEE